MTRTTPEWLYRPGDLADGPWETAVDDRVDGWQHTGIRVAELGDGSSADLEAGDVERIIVPLRGSFDVAYVSGEDGGAREQRLAGRPSVFAGPSDVLFLGAGSSATISGSGRVAVAEAPTAERRPARYMPAAEVPVEVRGGGKCTRQINNFGMPATLPEAARLLVCEVITPADNWSSYPPHKHDHDVPGREAILEEIYYFEAEASKNQAEHDPAAAFGTFHTYASEGNDISIDAIVKSGDVALVPHGYHGPAAAAPGYDLYYLNVMNGPGAVREWLAVDDPDHAWVRDEVNAQEPDPRLPLTR